MFKAVPTVLLYSPVYDGLAVIPLSVAPPFSCGTLRYAEVQLPV